MNKDLYAILGVKRTATNDEIRRAYRKLAKDLHPDQNKNDKKSEEQFKKVSAAFSVLGSPEKRKRYDAGEIDAMGNERANPFYREYAGGAQGFGKEHAGGPSAAVQAAAEQAISLIFSVICSGGEGRAAALSPCAAWTTATTSKSASWSWSTA